MKLNRLLLFLSLSFIAFHSISQTGIIKGVITDVENGEGLIGANILLKEGVGTVTDLDGNFQMEAEYGTYNLKISYIGYETVTRQVNLKSKEAKIEVAMITKSLKEVTIVADIAIDRETPVAFTNISTAKIEEELAAQDIPMVLNHTPGVYATQQGGGDGDARITIRGFSQRNIAVMIDGIPVNDMENGWVYWSNWFGLDAATRTIQVQRGLGASKLAIPSVGGTMNILTKGIEAKRSVRVKQEVGNGLYLKTSVGFNSGRLKNGWGVSLAASYKRGNGWVDEAFTRAWFYYFRFDKTIGNHMLTLSGMGAPQEHGQRSFSAPAAEFSHEKARELGIPDSIVQTYTERGFRYNEFWGYLKRDGEDKASVQNERINFFHKPQYYFRHSWSASDKFFLSNTAYVSIGNGGGTGRDGTGFQIDSAGQMNMQLAYDANQTRPSGEAKTILRASKNNHYWLGLLSTFNYQVHRNLDISGGIDLRNYRGKHYRQVYDLLGGQYYLDAENTNANREKRPKLGVGEKYGWHNDGLVRWAGVFGMVEYKKNGWSAFFNASGAATGYNKIDFFQKKDLILSDTTMVAAIGYQDTILYKEKVYTSNSAETAFTRSGWTVIPSYTFKAGLNYNIDAHHNVFINLGYLSRATRFNNVINLFNTQTVEDSENELIKAIELGYSFRAKKVKFNLNGYYTVWDNKPLDSPPTVPEDASDPDSDRIPVNINGIAALHKGIEFDAAYSILKNLKIEGLLSIGDWIWNSVAQGVVLDIHGDTVQIYNFDPSGVHVGDAAQFQVGGLIQYEPIKNLYVKAKLTYFSKNYSDFNPEELQDENARMESWQMPGYLIMDAHAGYRFDVGKTDFSVRLNVLNFLNNKYIADARNNDTFTQGFNDFDAKSASVFFGQGIRWNTSLQITF